MADLNEAMLMGTMRNSDDGREFHKQLVCSNQLKNLRNNYKLRFRACS